MNMDQFVCQICLLECFCTHVWTWDQFICQMCLIYTHVWTGISLFARFVWFIHMYEQGSVCLPDFSVRVICTHVWTGISLFARFVCYLLEWCVPMYEQGSVCLPARCQSEQCVHMCENELFCLPGVRTCKDVSWICGQQDVSQVVCRGGCRSYS